jgi:hypothetical protein
MLADAVLFTHNGTGGTSTLTVAGVTGYPQPSDVLGSSGTRLVDYEAAEYTDSTFSTLSKYEAGEGSLNLATGVLTRSVIHTTWVSGTGYNWSNPSAVNFGNTAANIRVRLGASLRSLRPAQPSIQNSFGDTKWQPINTRTQADTNAGTLVLTSGTEYLIPIEYAFGRPITSIGLEVTTAAAGNARLALFEWDTDGLGGNLITEFTSSTQIDLSTTTGVKSVTPATPVRPPPGFLFLWLQANVGATLRTYSTAGSPGVGIHSARDIMYFSKTGTYGAAPSVASKTGWTQVARNSAVPPSVVIK